MARALFASLLTVSALLAGCSGGGASGYPDEYMLGTYGVPDGYVLMDEDSEYWEFVGEGFGLEENPGYADPEALEQASEDAEEEGDQDIPVPDKLYMALYVPEDWDPNSGDFRMVWSMAAIWDDESVIDDAIENQGGDEALCEDFGSEEEDVAGFALRDGRIIAMVMALDEEAVGAVQEAADEMKAATGAQELW